jgi:hypothetical protein
MCRECKHTHGPNRNAGCTFTRWELQGQYWTAVYCDCGPAYAKKRPEPATVVPAPSTLLGTHGTALVLVGARGVESHGLPATDEVPGLAA